MSREVQMTELPDCDFHEPGADVKAVVDGRTKVGPWAYMCEAHWASEGVATLGTGHGQRIKVPT